MPPRPSARSFLAQAEELRQAGRTEDAIQALRELFSRSPDHIGGKLLLASLHQQAGRTAVARQVLEEILLMDPANRSASQQLRALDQPDEVVDFKEPTLPPLSALRGTDLFDRPRVAERLASWGHTEAAIACWQRIHQLTPIDPRPVLAIQKLSTPPELSADALHPHHPPTPDALARLRAWEKRMGQS